jgi:hypothetical protein
MEIWIAGVLLFGIGLMVGIERLLRALRVERVEPADAPVGLRGALERFAAAAERRAERRQNLRK